MVTLSRQRLGWVRSQALPVESDRTSRSSCYNRNELDSLLPIRPIPYDRISQQLLSFAFYRAMPAQSAVMRLHVVWLSVCPSVCLSVTIRYRVQIGLNSSKIISRPNSLRPLLWLTPNMGDLVQREHPQN